MKKTLKTILSLAFALLLVFQFAGSMDAQAAGEFNLTVVDGTAENVDVTVGSVSLADATVALAQANGITFAPDEGVYYVKAVSVAAVDMTAKLVATDSNKVMLPADVVSSLTLGSSVNLEVTLALVDTVNPANVYYDANGVTIYSNLTNGAGQANRINPFKAPDITAEAKKEALMLGYEFAGWDLVYANGATRKDVKVGDNIYPYMFCTLKAKWNAVTSVTITPNAQSKMYDGTAALVYDGSDPSHYSFKIYKGGVEQQPVNYTITGGSIVRTGDEKDNVNVNTAADAPVYVIEASGVTVKDNATGNAIDSKNIFYEKSSFGIYERHIVVKACDTSVEYTGDKLYPSAVEIPEYSPNVLVSGHNFGEVTYDKYAVRATTKEAGYTITPTKVVILDANGKDVTSNYFFDYEGGVMEVTKRKISIAPADNTVAYDGQYHSITYKVTAGSLGKNDTVVLTTNDTAHNNKGTFKNISITAVTINNSLVEAESTGSYEITLDTKSTATLTITGRTLVLKPVDREMTYDGTNTILEANDFEIVEGSLLSGHTIDDKAIKYSGSISCADIDYAASRIVEDSLVITNSAGDDVKAFYDIKFQQGTLTISPIKLYIQAGSASSLYNGKELLPNPSYTVTGNLLDKHEIIDVVVKGSQTYVGSSETYIESYKIVEKANHNVDITSQKYYDVTLVNGKVEVKNNPDMAQPETVTVSVKSLSKTYDGKPLSLSASDYTISDPKNATTGYELKVTVDTATSITDAGSANIAAPTVKVYKDGKEVTDYPFIIDAKGGTLTINKLVVTLTAASASKKYDGKALTCAKLASGGATVANSTGKLVGDHTLNMNDIVFQGSQTNVGSSANKIISATIRDGNGNSVNKNYDIKFIDGVLTVTSAAGTGTGTVAGGAASGDTSNIGLWIAIMAVLAVAAAAVVFIFFKKKKADQ